MAKLLLGKEVNASINEEIKAKVEKLKAQDITPTLGIIRIVDGKVLVKADAVDVPAQDAHAGGVEGRGEDLVPLFPAQHPAQALFQLTGGLVGKGDRQDIPWIHTYLINQPGDPVCKYTCLTGSCSGKDQKRTLCIENSLLLSVI